MDRIYVKMNNLAPVHQLGLNLWRDHVVRRPQIQDRLLSIMLDSIHRERTGEIIDRALIRATTQVRHSAMGSLELILDLPKASEHGYMEFAHALLLHGRCLYA